MNALVKKTLDQLTLAEQRRLNNYYSDLLYEHRNNDIIIQQKKWLKYACILLTDKFNFTPEQCMLFLANWRDMYIVNTKFENEQEQEEYLKTQMDRIFGENCYPEIFIKKLENL